MAADDAAGRPSAFTPGRPASNSNSTPASDGAGTGVGADAAVPDGGAVVAIAVTAADSLDGAGKDGGSSETIRNGGARYVDTRGGSGRVGGDDGVDDDDDDDDGVPGIRGVPVSIRISHGWDRMVEPGRILPY